MGNVACLEVANIGARVFLIWRSKTSSHDDSCCRCRSCPHFSSFSAAVSAAWWSAASRLPPVFQHLHRHRFNRASHYYGTVFATIVLACARKRPSAYRTPRWASMGWTLLGVRPTSWGPITVGRQRSRGSFLVHLPELEWTEPRCRLLQDSLGRLRVC